MSWMNNKIGPKDVVYHPINKEKCMNKPPQSVCRSSWETSFCKWLDYNKDVVQWASEPFGITYFDSTQKNYKGLPKKRKYYPDFLIKIKNRNDSTDIWLVEIKPYKETIPPRSTGRKSKKTKIYEEKTWRVNTAKWKSAQAYCNRKGWKFKILTERELLI